jgi:hypothetical protein
VAAQDCVVGLGPIFKGRGGPLGHEHLLGTALQAASGSRVGAPPLLWRCVRHQSFRGAVIGALIVLLLLRHQPPERSTSDSADALTA